MHIDNNHEEIKLLLHKALNLVEAVDLKNCFVPRAKAFVIIKIEEALLWLQYEGRSAPPEGQRK